MIYGEHLNAEEVPLKCDCGMSAVVEVVDRYGCSRGWFCRHHAERVRRELERQQKKLPRAIAIVKKDLP